MLTSTWALMFPKAKAENCVAFDPGNRLVRPWNDPKTVTFASMYSPHPLKVYVLPSRVLMWGSPPPHAKEKTNKQTKNKNKTLGISISIGTGGVLGTHSHKHIAVCHTHVAHSHNDSFTLIVQQWVGFRFPSPSLRLRGAEKLTPHWRVIPYACIGRSSLLVQTT